ncbi:MAG: mannose-1-phosphate guanylyltransferase/mannose-6-phosphate isomerase [Candidatus Methanoperedens sp.]|nr:mannose-1-phosphate guanylyltransferase/mannose-6-phosphate isomerase [Candidatus Methanoperedens sp.]
MIQRQKVEKSIKSIILAGGSGTRLWPLSREQYPKQFLKLGKTSLFQDTVLRCLKLSAISEIFVVTNEAQKFFVSGQVEELGLDVPGENILIEPLGKNTLPAICFGMHEIKKRFGKCSAAVFPSDHVLDMKAMEKIKRAEVLCSKYLVTFGITPSAPNTGYGYIKPGKNLDIGSKVLEFREKPTSEAAKKYILENCLWNSGMFMLDTGVFFKELKKYAPDIMAAFTENDMKIEELYDELPSISIDYGIMEKSDKVAVVPLEYKWSDLGDFDSLFQETQKNEHGNASYNCDDIPLNSNGNLIYSKKDKIVSLIDVKDMVVVDTPDALLVCPRKSCQKVKEIVASLKSENNEKAFFHRTVYRPWGSYTTMEESQRSKIKNITVMPGKKLSLQLHNHRSEHWVVVRGMAWINVDGKEFYLRQGESTFIKAGIKHRLSNPGTIPLEIIEVQLGDYVGEDDIERFEDDFGRG